MTIREVYYNKYGKICGILEDPVCLESFNSEKFDLLRSLNIIKKDIEHPSNPIIELDSVQYAPWDGEHLKWYEQKKIKQKIPGLTNSKV
ncbi:MAG: hypothetical protein AABY22_13575 [Nanoarchaeota archaeon]